MIRSQIRKLNQWYRRRHPISKIMFFKLPIILVVVFFIIGYTLMYYEGNRTRNKTIQDMGFVQGSYDVTSMISVPDNGGITV